ncbi:alpha/beta hydrolase [Sphingobacterium hungaricum]|uniref:XynC protein n=1 Tax=Sphingobacterium hungaricum TaxID=2082723 RepID=A0A928YR95_9SPHI|nr:alpha/beta hydrolase family protein [Sphingobacterium hungaricum]MBE8715076.1 XynC protein [Sphingobacterium hungaricum]
MKKINLFVSFILLVNYCLAAKVDTVNVFSQAMQKNIKTVIIQPEVKAAGATATLYLLHGYSGNYKNWVDNASHIKQLVDQYGYTVVCPDGGFGSWYWDIEGDQNFQYETFVSKELVDYVESNYPVLKDRKRRGITGLSMGGHGALYLAIKHPDVFSAAGSTAGGVDIRPFPDNWDMANRLGTYRENAQKWNEHTIMELTHLIAPKSLDLFIDCGTGDFFYGVNEELHRKLTYLNIPHHYLTLPGKHDWDYWRKSIVYQMAFFDSIFSNNR